MDMDKETLIQISNNFRNLLIEGGHYISIDVLDSMFRKNFRERPASSTKELFDTGTYLRRINHNGYLELGNILFNSGIRVEVLVPENTVKRGRHNEITDLTLNDGITRTYSEVYMTTLARRLALPEELITLPQIRDGLNISGLSTLDFINMLYNGLN